MKTFKIAVLALSVSAASFSTLAADTAKVSVQGSLTPAACSIIVDGNIDYGMKTVAELKQAGKKFEGYQLGTKSVPFTIQCNSNAATGLKVTADDLGNGASSPVQIVSPNSIAAATTPSNTHYAPLKDGDALLGYYTLALGEFTVDGNQPQRLVSSDGGKTWNMNSNMLVVAIQHDRNIISWTTTGEAAPTPATTVTGTVAVTAALIPDAVDAIKDTVNFNTNTTLQLTYL